MKGSGHEAAHEKINRGEIDVKAVKERILKRYSQEEIDAIIQLYSSAYGDCGMSPQEVLVEIICDSMGRMNAFATDATERVAGEVGVFLRNVRKAAKNTGATKNTTGDGGGKHSRVIEKTDSAVAVSREQRIKNTLDVASMDAVFTVTDERLSGSDSSILDIYTNQFEKWGNIIHSKKFGDIDAKKSAVKSETAHGSTKEKIASIEAIPAVVDEGKVISIIDKNQGVYRITIAAPILIGKTKYYMGVMLNKDAHSQRLYIHDVTISKEAFGFSQEHLSTTGHGKKRKNLFLSSILNNISVVKYKSELNRTMWISEQPTSRCWFRLKLPLSEQLMEIGWTSIRFPVCMKKALGILSGRQSRWKTPETSACITQKKKQ